MRRRRNIESGLSNFVKATHLGLILVMAGLVLACERNPSVQEADAGSQGKRSVLVMYAPG